MDGYSVSEAASVLGVPIERVWELLARGVLAGAPEGETGMRVFLQPRPGAPPAERPPDPVPNGGSDTKHELSPFRELLTEFRNLTERYGQALLALGESRGEVAALRSRVDMLEARMDLRLPGAGGAVAAGMPWTPAQPPPPVEERTVTPSAPAADAEEQHASRRTDADVGPEHRAARGPRRATESFAEALARAEDPSPPELPGVHELADAAVRPDLEPSAAAGLPRELPPAEPVPVADEPADWEESRLQSEPTTEAEPVPEPPEAAGEPAEPTWNVDRYTARIEDLDWLEAEAATEVVDTQVETESEVRGEQAPAVEAAPEPAPEAAVQPDLLPGSADLGDALSALRTAGGADGGTPAPGPTAPPRPARAPLPPSALRYRPVGSPGGPAGRAYRRLRRIFPD